MSLRIVACLSFCLSLFAVCACDDDPGPLVPAADLADFAQPAMEARPWLRWWWPGNDVEITELERELELIAAAGWGGVEIQPFDAALDPEASAEALLRRRSFGSEAYLAHLKAALAKARELGLQVDLSFGSGWPPSAAGIAAADSLQTLVHGEWDVTGPAQVDLALEPLKPPFYEVAELASGLGEQLTRYLPEEARLLAVMAYGHAGGLRMNSSLTLTDTVELAPDRFVDLSGQVDEQGRLRWSAPEGRWWILAFFRMPAGDWPTLSAEAGSPFVVDHFDLDRVTGLAETLFGEVLMEFSGDPLRAVFSDSFEFKVERFVSKDFLEEFAARRGYDLRAWLPVIPLPGADSFLFEAGRLERAPEFALGGDDERVRWDYRKTVSELFIERYLAGLEDWAQARGVAHRAQAYGADFEPLAAAGAVNYPETEQLYAGGADVFARLAASAAMLHGRSMVSAETFVFPLRDYMSTPAKMKAAADKLFSNGVNHLIYHGYPYAHADDYGLTGWAPFSSRFGGSNTFASNFGERSPFAAFLPAVNRYVARCQGLLRQGAGEVDVLVHYPFLGFPTSLALEEGVSEPLLGGWIPGEPELRQQGFEELQLILGDPVTDPRSLWLMAIRPRLAALEDRGFVWAWIDDESLASAEKDGGLIRAGQARARAVLLFETKSMEPAAAERLSELAREGLRVGLWGEAPGKQPGFGGAAEGDARVKAAFDELADAKGFCDLDEEALDVEPLARLEEESGLRLWHRRLESGGLLTFVRNPQPEAISDRMLYSRGCREGLYVLDAWNALVVAEETGDSVALSLPGYGSRFILCGDGPAPASLARAGEGILTDGPELALSRWDVEGIDAHLPGGALDLGDQLLGDWREDADLAAALSRVAYSTDFVVEAAGPLRLELGELRGAVEVFVDEASVGAVLVPPYAIDLGELSVGSHRLRLVFTPPWRNGLLALGASEDPRYAQFAGKQDTTIPTGLFGPVILRCGACSSP